MMSEKHSKPRALDCRMESDLYWMPTLWQAISNGCQEGTTLLNCPSSIQKTFLCQWMKALTSKEDMQQGRYLSLNKLGSTLFHFSASLLLLNACKLRNPQALCQSKNAAANFFTRKIPWASLRSTATKLVCSSVCTREPRKWRTIAFPGITRLLTVFITILVIRWAMSISLIKWETEPGSNPAIVPLTASRRRTLTSRICKNWSHLTA